MPARKVYTAEFLTQFQQQHAQQEEGPQEAPVQRMQEHKERGWSNEARHQLRME